MNYDLSFNLVWRHFDKLADGLLLSLKLATVSIVLAMAIGLSLALAYTDGNRPVRAAVTAYVEFVRNVPLLLLVYLVFYGLPTVVDIRYDAQTSFVATLSLYGGAYLVEVLRAGLQAVPQGLIEAGKAIGLTPLQRPRPRPPADRLPHRPALLEQHLRVPVQGHLHRLRARRAGARLRRPVDQPEHFPHRRGLRGGDADVPCHRLRHPLRASPSRTALRDAR
jgi:His/Glu/Gln/Arg/opine family amino acid ABC transporter permease subunit